MLLYFDNQLFQAPIGDSPQVRRSIPCSHTWSGLTYPQFWQKVLDIGTGTGIWAMFVHHLLTYLVPSG